MPFNFRIVLSGLMAVIPNRPRFFFAPTESLTVLLPNLRRPRAVGRPNPQPEILDPHFPFLVVPGGARLAESTRQADLTVPARQEQLFHLLGEEIEIRVPGLAQGFSMNTSQPRSLVEPTADESRSLFWLATVEDASPGFGAVNPAFLSADLDLENNDQIASRLSINAGHFCTNLLSEGACRFNPVEDDDVERLYAVRLALEFTDVPDRVILVLTRAGVSQELHLGQAAGELEVQLTNREFEDLLSPRDPRRREPAVVGRPLNDFDVFYGLTDNNNVPLEARRFLELVPPPPSPTRTGPVNPPHALCPPTGMTLKTKAA
ncbi:MAG: hypothetical protein ABUT39_23545 [Acidobacteriota bacterium]